MIYLFYLYVSLASLSQTVSAAPGESAKPEVQTEPVQAETRGRIIHFDDEVVEGMNKSPMDALESIGDPNRDKNAHLYRKKTDFHPEMKQQSKEAGYLP